jgi:outer membrane protein TolC
MVKREQSNPIVTRATGTSEQRSARWGFLIAVVLITLVGCTVHPQGERQERELATTAGKPYEKTVDQRPPATLPANPTPDDLVRVALANNPDVERAYWEWRAALEQVPIDGTQATNLAIFGSVGINNGKTSWGQTTLAAGNDPMADIVLPNKLDAAARRALEYARAAGKRFRKTQWDLRNKVLAAYYDYALTAELVRLGHRTVELLETTAMVSEARNRAGSAGQQDVLKAQNELDMARNDLASLEAQLPPQRAAVNDLLNRAPDAPLPIPDEMPTTRQLTDSDANLLASLDAHNPDLVELADEIRARQVGIETAKLQFQPDFSITAGSDLRGIAQTISGMITVPILKYEAIHAAVAQAEANLRATESMRRQTTNDTAAQAVTDLATLKDADRQLDLLRGTIVPRAERIVTVARTAYESGSASLLDLLDGQRSLLDMQRLLANLQTTRNKRLADIESLAAAGQM